MLIAMLSGLAAGAVHVVTGPDHLAAISPLAIQQKKSAGVVGLRWGLGHTSGVCVLGLFALLFREVFPLEALSGYSEKLVGIMLICIGLWGMKKAFPNTIHTHTHAHDSEEHTHYHIHGTVHAHETQKVHRHFHAAFGVGILHGLAGTSHIFGIIPALAFASRAEAAAYLLSFGIGTVLSMAAFSSVLGFLSEKAAFSGAGVYQKMFFGFSSLAIGIGMYWIIA